MAAEVKALLLEHKVLFARDQEMTDAEHAAFAALHAGLCDVARGDPAEHLGLAGTRWANQGNASTAWNLERDLV